MATKKKLPSSLQLGSHKIQVVRDPLLMTDHGNMGICRYHKSEIAYQNEVKGVIMSESAMEHTIWHEIIHYILYFMGESELNQNEVFVDLLANYIVQAKNTLK